MRTLIAAVAGLAILSSVARAEQYLCVPDGMTGFSFDKSKKAWVKTNFTVNYKYLIAPAKNGKDTWAITRVGEKEPFGWCEKDFNDGGFLFCDPMGGEFKFNKLNGRYLAATTLGYYAVGPDMWAKTDEDSSDVEMEIGKCSPF
jgi:hypothetical protein